MGDFKLSAESADVVVSVNPDCRHFHMPDKSSLWIADKRVFRVLDLINI